MWRFRVFSLLFNKIFCRGFLRQGFFGQICTNFDAWFIMRLRWFSDRFILRNRFTYHWFLLSNAKGFYFYWFSFVRVVLIGFIFYDQSIFGFFNDTWLLRQRDVDLNHHLFTFYRSDRSLLWFGRSNDDFFLKLNFINLSFLIFIVARISEVLRELWRWRWIIHQISIFLQARVLFSLKSA